MKVVLAQVIGAQWDDYEGIWYAATSDRTSRKSLRYINKQYAPAL